MLQKFKIFILLLLPLFAFAEKRDVYYKRTVVKEFQLSPGGMVQLENRYGKVDIKLWDKNEMKANIVITGFGSSDKQAREMAESIDIEAGQNGNSLKVATVYNAKGKKWWQGNLRGNIKKQVNIDYEVYLPRNLSKLSIGNNFGDVLANELPFPTLISLNYGYYHVGTSKGLLTLHMNYVDKSSITNADNVEVHCNYSDMKFDNVKRLKISANNGDFSVEKAEELSVDCNYGDMNLGSIGSLSISSNYTDYNVRELRTSGKFNTTYGDIKIGRLGMQFKGIESDMTYSDLSIKIPSKLQFGIKARLTYGDVRSGGFEFQKVNNIKKSSHHEFTGYTSSSTDLPMIRMSGTYSDLKISKID
ncbi:hypothetical protein COR50_21000 [Chitinophaga caeni]|uniref:DUF4097 domain-containing protein n=1 Tax=Chitinophaga caeni TaxID=2029983 RepID=A0A291R030_9BACT|nr:DUF4097 family beta strand repeat-containing protein [Chitinophaga caeni]ATL49454.1 hypothetical protein COR50_21000 [Chitinophaga caeni]